MKKLVIAAVMFCSAGGVFAAEADPSAPMAAEEGKAFFQCLQGTDQTLRSAKSAPERYQMALRGMCLQEEADVLKAARAHLMGLGRGSRISVQDLNEITAGTMKEVEGSLSEYRASMISNYVVWFETTVKPGG